MKKVLIKICEQKFVNTKSCKQNSVLQLWAKSCEQQLLSIICEWKLWTKAVNNSFQQNLWTRVANKSCEQKLKTNILIKNCEEEKNWTTSLAGSATLGDTS